MGPCIYSCNELLYQEKLNFKTDIKYNTWARDELSVRPWNSDNVNIRRRFREAIAENPFLNVLIQSGYYDGATTFSAAKYTIQQVDPSGKLKESLLLKVMRVTYDVS